MVEMRDVLFRLIAISDGFLENFGEKHEKA